MSQNEDVATTFVLDAGGRYGLHPTWKSFSGDLRYFLFEPDTVEAARLAAKYDGRPQVTVEACALGAEPGRLTLNVARHHGQSSAFPPASRSFWFTLTRPGEGDLVSTYEAPVVTVDAYCEDQGIALDFLKSDTEGSDLLVLKGAENQLGHIIGLRCETHFERAYEGAPDFAEMFSYLTACGFFLLNLDYAGQGAPCNKFYTGDRYGILTGTDATWMKHPEAVLAGAAAGRERAARSAKYACFCMANGASDLAMHMLDLAVRQNGVTFADIADSKLLRQLDIHVQKLFYSLLQHPAYDKQELGGLYTALFGRPLKSMHEFHESSEFNPT